MAWGIKVNKTGLRPVSSLQLKTDLPTPYCKIEKEEEGNRDFGRKFENILGEFLSILET